jgi:type I restriction enzyme M protein
LIFEKGAAKFRGTHSVWFYDLMADGFSLDDKRSPIDANDIPGVLAKWPKREEGPNSYRVPIDKIRENEWSLAAGRYKLVTTEAVSHDAPAKILSDVLKLEGEIVRRGNALLAQVADKK